MAEINLLKQTHNYSELGNTVPRILVRVFLVVLGGLIAYYAWLYIDSRNIEGQIISTQAKMNSDQQSAMLNSSRAEVLTRQQQLKLLSSLISNHPYWSQLFPELANVTLKTASYSSLSVGVDGSSVSLSASVPSLQDLAKYMQVFDQPDFNKNFNSVQIGGLSKVAGKNGTSIQFSVTMKFNPQLIKYNPPKQ